MSVPNDDVMPSSSSQLQIISEVFSDLLDSIIVDVASECHRIARLGLDSNLEEEEEELRLSAEARAKGSDPSNSGDTNGKYVVDIFGQTHPSIAAEVFECMNCGQSIAAGRFAPHLEKCMGKGRKARRKVTRSTSAAAQTRQTRASTTASSYSPNPNPTTRSTTVSRIPNGNSGGVAGGEEYSSGMTEDF